MGEDEVLLFGFLSSTLFTLLFLEKEIYRFFGLCERLRGFGVQICNTLCTVLSNIGHVGLRWQIS